MKDDRLSIPMDPGYAAALGVALYAFGRLEWDVIWCCERMEPGSITKLTELTSGVVKKRFRKLSEQIEDDALRTSLLQAADQFDPLVDIRNDFVHGNPFTDSDGGQRVGGKNGTWTVERLEEAADEFTTCSRVFNAFVHGALSDLAAHRSMVLSDDSETA
ncbi:hypothetical protein [Pseudomonas sp. LS.1a]|uniref:hypothetical protein n=1 Tax=Pseudomonas sp. LS.1a TaxID=2920387 RepID=UPI001F137621|nr:hypothetical protein [Pseudomonas sp. LS.1a]UMY63918.1 hypothetical protein MKK04_12065 [Pseudomonas sp. LS.1a]